MSTYQHKDMCYTATADLFTAVASDCPVLTNAGYPVLCTPTSTGIQVKTYTTMSDFTTSTYTPPLNECAIDVTSIVELSWLVVAVLIAAYCVTQIRKPIK